MRLIDADKFLSYLIYSGLIDDAKCGNIVKAIEKCEVKAISIDRVEQIKAEIEQEYNKFRNMSDQWDERACGLGTALEIIGKAIKEAADDGET